MLILAEEQFMQKLVIEWGKQIFSLLASVVLCIPKHVNP
jgi:hypothetical protein